MKNRIRTKHACISSSITMNCEIQDAAVIHKSILECGTTPES